MSQIYEPLDSLFKDVDKCSHGYLPNKQTKQKNVCLWVDNLWRSNKHQRKLMTQFKTKHSLADCISIKRSI